MRAWVPLPSQPPRMWSPRQRDAFGSVMRRANHSPRRWLAAGLLVLLSGCVAAPHYGKDEGRAAVVWEHKSLVPPATSAVPADTERQLVGAVHDAEETKEEEPLHLATALYDLAILRRTQGDFAEAEQLYRRALAIRERAQGGDHPDVAVVLTNLAALKVAQGDFDAAQPLLERSLAIRETALGKDDVRTAQSLSNLALLYAARGNAAAAEPLYLQSIAIFDAAKNTGPAHTADFGRVLENYAALLHETGRDAEADQLEARAHAMTAATAVAPANPR
jgi:tetratricopeptide (TPR) repeat protein